MDIYVIQPNDTIDEISEKVQVPVQQLIWDNQLMYPCELAVGQALFINNGSIVGTGRQIQSNGYAYPFISHW